MEFLSINRFQFHATSHYFSVLFLFTCVHCEFLMVLVFVTIYDALKIHVKGKT